LLLENDCGRLPTFAAVYFTGAHNFWQKCFVRRPFY